MYLSFFVTLLPRYYRTVRCWNCHREEFDWAFDLRLQGSFSPQKKFTHTNALCIQRTTLRVSLLEWWMRALKTNIHCNLSSAVQVWLRLRWPADKQHLTAAARQTGRTHNCTTSHTCTHFFCNYDGWLSLWAPDSIACRQQTFANLVKGRDKCY